MSENEIKDLEQSDTTAYPEAPELTELDYQNLYGTLTAGSVWTYTPNGETRSQIQKPVPEEYTKSIEEIRSGIEEMISKRIAELKKLNPNATHWDVPPFHYNGGEESLRVTLIPPTTTQEIKLIIRKLSPILEIDELMMDKRVMDSIEEWMRLPGLTIVTGRFMTRKTTHCNSYLNYMLKKYPGTAIVIESPAECDWSIQSYRRSHCIQIDLSYHPNAGTQKAWNDASEIIRKSGANRIYCGEISTPEAAKFLLQVTSTGIPVLANTHGDSITSAIDNLEELGIEAGVRDYRKKLIANLNGMTNQFVKDGKPDIEKLKIRDVPVIGDKDIKTLLIENDPNTAEAITKYLEVDNRNGRNS